MPKQAGLVPSASIWDPTHTHTPPAHTPHAPPATVHHQFSHRAGGLDRLRALPRTGGARLCSIHGLFDTPGQGLAAYLTPSGRDSTCLPRIPLPAWLVVAAHRLPQLLLHSWHSPTTPHQAGHVCLGGVLPPWHHCCAGSWRILPERHLCVRMQLATMFIDSTT